MLSQSPSFITLHSNPVWSALSVPQVLTLQGQHSADRSGSLRCYRQKAPHPQVVIVPIVSSPGVRGLAEKIMAARSKYQGRFGVETMVWVRGRYFCRLGVDTAVGHWVDSVR